MDLGCTAMLYYARQATQNKKVIERALAHTCQMSKVCAFLCKSSLFRALPTRRHLPHRELLINTNTPARTEVLVPGSAHRSGEQNILSGSTPLSIHHRATDRSPP